MILLVDDQNNVLTFLKAILEKLQSEVIGLASAEEAMKLVKSRMPDLIICDVMMPGMDGFEFRKWYESEFPYRRTPFIFHSALNSDEDEIKGLNLGADYYLRKPVEPELLMARVRAILRARRRNLSDCFEGSLRNYSEEYIFRFCKRSGLTGAVFFQKGSDEMMWTFKNGKLLTSPDQKPEDVLKRIAPFKDGDFKILVTPPEFDDFVNENPGPKRPDETQVLKNIPPGKLSGFKLGKKHVDVQTEIQQLPFPSLVSTVFSGGKLLKSFSSKLDTGWDCERMTKELTDFHCKIEKETRKRISSKIS